MQRDGYGYVKGEVVKLLLHEAMILIVKGFALLTDEIKEKIEAKIEKKASKKKPKK